MARVEFDPLRSKHKVNMLLIFISPVFQHLPQVKLADHLMSRNQSVHVSFQAEFCVYAFLVELYFNKAVWVGSNNKVYFCPIYHDYLFYVVYHVWQLSSINLIHASLFGSWLEIAMENLVFMEPFGLQNLIMSDFIRVIAAQIGQYIVGLCFCWQETVFVLPVVRVHAQVERLITDFLLRLNVVEPFYFLLVEEVIVAVGHPLIILKQSTSRKLLNSGSLRLSEIDISILLFSGVLENLVWRQMVGQLSDEVVVASSEAPLNQISLFVGVVVQH